MTGIRRTSSVFLATTLIFLLWTSSVFGQAGETVCLQCHAAQPGRLGEPVAQWRQSIHAANGISCHDCHGGDPTDMAMAMSPARGFLGVPTDGQIPGFCGRCHVGVEQDYRESAHGQALGAGGPQCVTCHGNHAVTRATPDLINRESCSRCHDYGRADELKAAIVETDGMISTLEEELRALHLRGVAVKELQDGLFALRNDFHRLFHTVDVEKVNLLTVGFQEQLQEIRGRVTAIRGELARRRLGGVGAVALLLAGAVLALLLHRSYLRDLPG